MKVKKTLRILILPMVYCFTLAVTGQESFRDDRWSISDANGIILRINDSTKLPYKDHIEMSGRKVATIIDYEIDSLGNLKLERDVIFPQLRVFPKSNEAEWKKYRAYFRKVYTEDTQPKIIVDNEILAMTRVDSVRISGMLRFYHRPIRDIQVVRTFYPSMDNRFIVEQYELTNRADSTQSLRFSNVAITENELGYKGNYIHEMFSEAADSIQLAANETYTFPVYYGATLNQENKGAFEYQQAFRTRKSFLDEMYAKLQLETPDSIINTLFYFSKIRAAESIFDSSMGLVHSPGGGNYYVGIWANDQIEYSGPFFPFLGYVKSNIAAYNAYITFLKNIPKDNGNIPYAFEVDGNFKMNQLDRGDAAMLAYGTSLFLLASGDQNDAEELWPLVEWAIEHCHNKRNKEGAVQSDSDEMEGRMATGRANLSTSSLYYSGLIYASRLAEELGKTSKQIVYQKRAEVMKQVIEDYFGARLDGLETYKYFEKNTKLRHWIALPLAMGIEDRKEGTLTALFDKLWTPNGILVEKSADSDIKDVVFWDRATLYALRGAMRVGAVDQAFQKLQAYSRKRLLGDHVPYAIEAFPENDMRHLSAESALYCRIFIEGLLGIEPIGFKTTELRPKLPSEWNFMELKDVYISGKPMTITLQRMEQTETLQVQIRIQGRTVIDKKVKNGGALFLRFF